MRIEDVLTPNICVCRTEEGRFLDGEFSRFTAEFHSTYSNPYSFNWCSLYSSIFPSMMPLCLHDNVDVKQTMLETIVPKTDSEDVMVVLGEHRGQVSE